MSALHDVAYSTALDEDGAAPSAAAEKALLVIEEALDALLMRVRWYYQRGKAYAVPRDMAMAFNHLCDVLGKPDEKPWTRIRR